MDPNLFTRRRQQSPSKDGGPTPTTPTTTTAKQQNSSNGVAVEMKKYGSSAMGFTKALAGCLLALPLFLFLVSLLVRYPPSDLSSGFADARVLDTLLNVSSSVALPGSGDAHAKSDGKFDEKLLDGLLAAGFDEASCTSRYRTFSYRKASRHKPSPHLISRLRSYEELHKRCGPDTPSYKNALKQLVSDKKFGSGDCRYLVWISFSGLGNRILSLASTFLYAVLTDRVLLVDRGKDMEDLFCEPFPEKSWLLPTDFPLIDQFNGFGQDSKKCYGNMLKNSVINTSVISYVYLHLVHDYGDLDKLFFCDADQSYLADIPWLIVKTDNYFVPSLFLIEPFKQELSKLFPEKGSVFHHLGRYLFHPTNHVWGLISRYYQAYLAKADERVGLQIRVFDTRPGPLQHVMDQILACTVKENLLPQVDMVNSADLGPKNPKLKAVLVTSLNSGYSEYLRNMYWESSTMTGEVVAVYQPSHEEYQQSEKQTHNRKAWAEMYLLSLTDMLVTSSWSTFGYVAQGLGGLKPWILYKPENDTTPDPPCRRAMSMEPCFHAPPFYDCKNKRGTDTGALVPHVRHCEDMSWGLKVVDSDRDEL